MRLRKSSGLIMDLRMDEGSGTVAGDSSRYGNDGAVNGGVEWTDKGMRFDGSTGYLDCGNDSSLSPTVAITVSAWMKYGADSTSFNGMVVNSTGYSIYSRSTSSEIRFMIGNDYADIPFAAIDGTEWIHVVGTYDLTNIKIYYNGNHIDTEPSVLAIPSSGNVFVGDRNTTGLPFNGVIDDARIHNRALSAREIRKQYDAGKHRYE